MKFRTICPHCASTFRLGPDQLDAAEGWVQCGVCGSPFDAYPTLLKEDGTPLEMPVERAPAPLAAFEAPPGAAEAEEIVAPPPVETEPVAPVATAANVPTGIAQRESVTELASIILIDPNQPADDDFGPLPEITPSAAPLLVYPAPKAPAPVAPPAPAPVEARAAVQVEYARTFALPAESEITPPEPEIAARRPRTLAWAVASVLLLATLLGQAAYFLRDSLASTFPQTRPALEQACAVLGCTLGLPRQLDQLRVVGSDLQTEATERLRLTLTLGNRSAQAQAWPILVLTLTDQNNRPLTRRSFAPSEYLGDPARAAAGIPPLSEHALNLPLGARNIKPMGFDLRLTY